ncbi:unnamed protein product [Urochloa humidicola]
MGFPLSASSASTSPASEISTASQVDCLFKEYVARREGLIKAFDSGLETLVEESKKVGEHTPYEQRKFLWGLEDKSWELRGAVYGECEPQPQPLLAFEEGLQLDKWVSRVADYSDAWLAGFLAYKSLSFSLQERIELMNKMAELPGLKFVISLKDLKPDQWPSENESNVDCQV